LGLTSTFFIPNGPYFTEGYAAEDFLGELPLTYLEAIGIGTISIFCSSTTIFYSSAYFSTINLN